MHLTKQQETRRVLAVARHPVGGIRTFFCYTYPLLVREGYRFTFVLPATEDSRTFAHEIKSWPDVEIVEAPTAGRHRQHCRFVATVRKLLRENRFSLIHSTGIIAATQVVRANVGFGVPHIATSQDMIRNDQFSGILGLPKRLAVGGLLSRVDRLVTVTQDARDNHLKHLPWLGWLKRPIAPILNGIDTDRFKPNDVPEEQLLRRHLQIDENVFLAGFLGRFMKQKGFLVLLDAIELLASQGLPRPFHLIAMESGDHSREYLAEAKRRPNASNCITFLPRVPNTAPILQQLDLIVMPSLWEACGILAMEAMAMGVPVLGSNCPGLREVLRDSPSTIVPPENAVELAKALGKTISNPWKDAAMKYIPKARERFDVRHTADKLLGLFNELTRKHE